MELIKWCLLVGVFLFSVSPAWADSHLDDVDFSMVTEFENTTDVSSEETRKRELSIKPKLELQLSNNIRFTGVLRARYDGVDRLEPGEPEQPEIDPASRRYFINDHAETELREFYFDIEIADLYLRIGKQQVVWGKTDGLKILDVVNPQSFREFILDDFEDSRIPLWTVNVEFTLGEWDLQFLWVPDKTYNELPKSGSPFAFTSSQFVPDAPPPGVQIAIEDPERPDEFLKDSDYGFRLSTFLGGWDLSLNYFYHYYDNPALVRTLTIENGQPIVRVTPEYKRTHLIGGTFSNAFGNLTLRGELGYSNSRYFFVNDLEDDDGIVKSGELVYVLGFDWQGFENSFLSFQWFQSILDNHLSTMGREATESSVTILLQRKFLNESLVAEVLWLTSVNHKDGLVRPKVSYDLSDEWKIWVGVDSFYGEPEGFYGQFDDKDQLRLGIQWGI